MPMRWRRNDETQRFELIEIDEAGLMWRGPFGEVTYETVEEWPDVHIHIAERGWPMIPAEVLVPARDTRTYDAPRFTPAEIIAILTPEPEPVRVTWLDRLRAVNPLAWALLLIAAGALIPLFAGMWFA